MKVIKRRGIGKWYIRCDNWCERIAVKRRFDKSIYFTRWFALFGCGKRRNCEIVGAWTVS